MISEEQLDRIAAMAAAEPLSEEIVTKMRGTFEGVHFTYCMDDDVCEVQPVREAQGFNLYLIDGRDHCLAFTRDTNIATGVVIAEVMDDE